MLIFLILISLSTAVKIINLFRSDITVTTNSDASLVYNHGKYCSNNNQYEWETLYIKGMYNTGTNALNGYMKDNCKHSNMEFIRNVKGGKHQMRKNSAPRGIQRDFNNKILLLYIIKDPVTWIKSMCHHPYDFTLRDINGEIVFGQDINDTIYIDVDKCINEIYSTDTYLTKKGGDGLNRTMEWNTFEQYYNQFYMKPFELDKMINGNSNLNFEYSFVMIRFEDLLFKTKSVIKQLCKCVNGSIDEFNLNGTFKKSNSTQRAEALTKYLPKHRYDHFTQSQLRYIKRNINSLLLDSFEYNFN